MRDSEKGRERQLKDLVFIGQSEPAYCSIPPFSPDIKLPGYLFGDLLSEHNPLYNVVRQLLVDIAQFQGAANPTGNPLGWLIKPGDRVVVKPNLVKEPDPSRIGEQDVIVTHGSIIRVVVDYVLIALQGNGEVIIADSPQTDSDFELIIKNNGLREVVEFYKAHNMPVTLLDLREERWQGKNGVIEKRIPLPGDPRGYARIDLGGLSAFGDYRKSGKFYGAYYDTADLSRFHSMDKERHCYVVSKTIMDADVFINLPKMKTHKKAGVTLSLKNAVGICTHKNSLPHHTLGTPEQGGDECPSSDWLARILVLGAKLFHRTILCANGRFGFITRLIKVSVDAGLPVKKRRVRNGNWYGNDTIWRTIVDLNRVLLWFDSNGSRRSSSRRYLTLVDAIVAGEGEGPMEPDPKPVGLILASTNPVAVDAVAAYLMGFDFNKIPSITGAALPHPLPLFEGRLEDVSIQTSGSGGLNVNLGDIALPDLGFKPNVGWRRHIER